MTAHTLAHLVGGMVSDGAVFVWHGDTLHAIECRPNGRVILDGCFQLGSFSDGPDLLAAKFRAVVSAPLARIPGGEPTPRPDDEQTAVAS